MGISAANILSESFWEMGITNDRTLLNRYLSSKSFEALAGFFLSPFSRATVPGEIGDNPKTKSADSTYRLRNLTRT
jgi:hypothetical protein